MHMLHVHCCAAKFITPHRFSALPREEAVVLSGQGILFHRGCHVGVREPEAIGLFGAGVLDLQVCVCCAYNECHELVRVMHFCWLGLLRGRNYREEQ